MRSKIHAPNTFHVLTTLHEVESRIQKPVTSKVFNRLISELDLAQKQCEDERLTQQIVTLYGKVLNEYHTYLETQVQKLETLANLSSPGDYPLLKRKMEALKAKEGIPRLLFDRLCSMERRLEEQELPPSSPIEEILPEEIDTLFEVASSVYYNEGNLLKKTYPLLSRRAEKTVLKHLSSLRCRFGEDKQKTLQALFASAYELAGQAPKSYPTQDEIQMFFKEKEAILKEEEQKSRKQVIVPFEHLA